MSGDFLSRWSRRKRGAEREEEPLPAPEVVQPEVEAEAEPAITAEELAALPKPEDITADSDILAFFRKGVPEALRNAALRRLWSIDPAIRDFEGHARDYAWDWNVPGGVPGNGPLLPTDDVEAMARQIFGDAPANSDREGPAESQPEPEETAEAASSATAAPEEGEPEDGGDPSEFEPRMASGDPAVSETIQPEQPKEASGISPAPAALRRHGRARPV